MSSQNYKHDMSSSHSNSNMEELAKVQIEAIQIFNTRKIVTPVAVLFADMTNSSGQNYHQKDNAWRNIVIHNEYCRSQIEQYGGAVIKYIGDGVMGRFDLSDDVNINSVLDAAKGIMEMIYGAALFETKIGISICQPGEAINIAHGKETKHTGLKSSKIDLIGSPVDLAARLTDMAKPGQILVTSAVYNLVATNEYIFNGPVERMIKGPESKESIYELSWQQVHHALNLLGIDTSTSINTLGELQNEMKATRDDIRHVMIEHFTILKKLNNNDIVDILPPSSNPESGTTTTIDKYLSMYLKSSGMKTIRAYGIALRKLFHQGSVLSNTLLENEEHFIKNCDLDMKAIILDPNSEAARMRSKIEGAAVCSNQKIDRSCIVQTDILLSIDNVKIVAEHFKEDQFSVKTCHYLPPMWFLMTHERLFFEQYHIGRTEDRPHYQCLGGTVPVIVTGKSSPWYKYFENHFNFLWGLDNNTNLNEVFHVQRIEPEIRGQETQGVSP